MTDEAVAPGFQAAFASLGRAISLAPDWDGKRLAWRNGLHEALTNWHGIDRTTIVDECYLIAEAKGLTDQYSTDEIQRDIADEVEQAEQQPAQPTGNGKGYHGPDAEAEIVPPSEPKRATPYDAPDPASIPKRAWLHGGHYIRQAATATVAPGGFGKTTLTLYEAVNMVAAGLSVWYLSGEDPKVEIDRRIAAHCQHHGIELAQLPGRLFVDDRSTFNLFIGKSPRAAFVTFDEASLTQFELAIVRDKIDVVMLDPFVSFHAVPENDNGCVDAVVKRLALIAYRTNACVEISHHVRKPFVGQGSITVDDARGGGAIINAVRSGRVINRMTTGEAETAKVDLDQRARYVRLDRGKRNMAPPDKATWFRLVSVVIGNTDNVQALETWDFPALMDGITVDDTEWVRDLVRQHAYRADSRSDDWLGVPVAMRLNLNVNDKEDCKKLNKLFGVWMKNNVFKKQTMRDAKARKDFAFYVGMDAKPERAITAEVVQLFERQAEDDED
jgi:hypothetical protein